MLANRKQQQQQQIAVIIDDEIEFSCPNCGTVIGASEARPISIGCIVRFAMETERTQRRALHTALSNDNSEIPPISQEAMGEIFTSASSRYTYFPPILTSMKFTIADLQKRKPLLKKVVRTCVPCYERFVDDIEMRRQLKEDLAAAKLRPQRPPQSGAAARLEPVSPICSRTPEDRRSDMAFTSLQVHQRHSSRTLSAKQTVREKLIHTIGGNTDALGIDWEVVPASAVREMRRTAQIVGSTNGGGMSSGSPAGTSGPAVEGSASAHASGDVIFRRGRNYAPPPLSFMGIGEDPVTAFDVSLETRLMADLFAKVTAACGEFATESNQPVPMSHPLYPVYRQNHNRLPAPPIPHVHAEIPHPFEHASVEKQQAVPSEIRALEDAPNLCHTRRTKVDAVISSMGWGGYTEEEMRMLAGVIADDTIVVESDEDEEDEESDESDYDSEGWQGDGMYY